MQDKNLEDFNKRVGRIETAHSKGFGFEIPGTRRQAGRKRGSAGLWRYFGFPLLIVAACIFGLKGAAHHFMGAKGYETRVAELAQSQGFDRFGAVLMHADPVTLWVSTLIRKQAAG